MQEWAELLLQLGFVMHELAVRQPGMDQSGQ